MFLIQFTLVVNVLQCLVVSKQNKLPWKKVMSPLFQGLDDSIKFLITNTLFLPRFIQIFTEKGY